MKISNKHHQSTGHYFSWGNRGNYGMFEKSSGGGYTCKRGDKVKMNSEFIDFMMNTELISVIKNEKNTSHLALGCSTSNSCFT